MKIVVDSKIPFIRPSLSQLGVELVYLDGASIGPEDVKDADALIVRTRTHCNASLLDGSKVRYVATTTIGFDHIDTDYMEKNHIRWMNCPGCNASSVEQYVRSCLLLLQQSGIIRLQEAVLGVVGYGHVGKMIAAMGRSMGMKIQICDPFVSVEGKVDIQTLEATSDVISYHVPLTRSGQHPTYHLCDGMSFDRMNRCPVLINTSRGEVVDNLVLLQALRQGKVREAIIDTWENEPNINTELLEKVYLGTPHIAGYSADGKANADNMVLDDLCRFFSLPRPPKVVPPSLPDTFVYDGNPLQLYDPRIDSEALKRSPSDFELLRGNYRLRREHHD